MPLTGPQRHRAIGLYRTLLRTSRTTFSGDARAIAGAHAEIRTRFRAGAYESDPAKIEEALKMGEEVVIVLRRNVVQGQWAEERNAFNLRMTADTELGNNDSIKKARAQQIADLKASKGKARPGACGGAPNAA